MHPACSKAIVKQATPYFECQGIEKEERGRKERVTKLSTFHLHVCCHRRTAWFCHVCQGGPCCKGDAAAEIFVPSPPFICTNVLHFVGLPRAVLTFCVPLLHRQLCVAFVTLRAVKKKKEHLLLLSWQAPPS